MRADALLSCLGNLWSPYDFYLESLKEKEVNKNLKQSFLAHFLRSQAIRGS